MSLRARYQEAKDSYALENGDAPVALTGGATAQIIREPSTSAHVATLAAQLTHQTRLAYEGALVSAAAAMGIHLAGSLADPQVHQQLRQRAQFAASSIATTYQRDLARGQKSGKDHDTIVLARRAKPSQVAKNELGIARFAAIRDFLTANDLPATATVDPASYVCALCGDLVDMGAVSRDVALANPLPLHPRCPHTWLWDFSPAADLLAGKTAQQLQGERFWTGGLFIIATHNDQQDQQDESAPSDELLETSTRRLTAAFDLDDSALQWPKQLVPLAVALHEQGAAIGIITGNDTANDGAARRRWDTLGYPEPTFVEIHGSQDLSPLGTWKAQQCAAHQVDVLIDDFKHGNATVLRQFMKHRPARTLALAVLTPPGTPMQHVESERVLRTVRKYDVAPEKIPPVAACMTELGPDPFDPDFCGQVIRSIYYDDRAGTLAAAKRIDTHYVTLRHRIYVETDTHFLEAKTEDAKYRCLLPPEDSARMEGTDILSLVAQYLPEIVDVLSDLTGGGPLGPVGTTTYRRYARETGPRRMTLDVGMRDDCKSYPCAILEVKDEGAQHDCAGLDDLDLVPIDLSKFLWAVDP